MRITDVRTTKRGRRSIYIEGEFYAAIHPDAAAEFGIYGEMEIDEARLEEALRRSREIEAGQKAMRLLSGRSYTAKKLREKLAPLGEDAAETATARMEELGLVNDRDYARRYAEYLYETKFFAPRRIRHALMERGVPADVAREAADAFDPDDNVARAAIYLSKKYPMIDDEKNRNRAGAALGRLGYSGAETIKALAAAGCREEEY